jgi:hypothetical protein
MAGSPQSSNLKEDTHEGEEAIEVSTGYPRKMRGNNDMER